ncbi:MAG: hypothetical protein ACM3VY_00205, partial [Candidatus Bathyarchaeota archaeon]
SEAYRIAYPKSRNWKQETVRKRASEMMDNGDVLGMVEKLKTENAKRSAWTRDDSIQILSEIARDDKASRKDKTQAVKVLNDMHGFNAPKEVRVRYSEMTDEQIEAELQRVEEQLGKV